MTLQPDCFGFESEDIALGILAIQCTWWAVNLVHSASTASLTNVAGALFFASCFLSHDLAGCVSFLAPITVSSS